MAARIEEGIDPQEARALGADEVDDALTVEPGGAFTARAGDGTALGVVTCVVWERLAWIGDLRADPAVAPALLARALAHGRARGAEVFGADVPAEQRALLEAEGFRAVGESARWSAGADALRAPDAASGQYAIYPVSPAEMMELAAYDRPAFGVSRAPWLAALVAAEPYRSFVAIHRTSGAFSGLALTARDRIGPLMAAAPEAAAWLLHAARKSGAPARALVPAWNARAEALFAHAGFRAGERRVRMARGELPGDASAAYALAGWSLG